MGEGGSRGVGSTLEMEYTTQHHTLLVFYPVVVHDI